WPGPTSDRLAGASRVGRDLTALRDDVVRFLNTPGQFEAIFGERTIDVGGIDAESRDASWVEGARAISLADWFDRAKGMLQVEEPEAWFRLAEAWGRNIATNDSETFEATLRFPLVGGFDQEVQTAGWVRWLETRMDLEHRFLSLVVSSDLGAVGGHLTVIAREILPDDFLLMTPLSGSLAYVDDLAQVRDIGTKDISVEAEDDAVGTSDESEEREGDVERGARKGGSGPAAVGVDMSRPWVDFLGGAT
ncbi:MAG: hypothetical protein JXQ75_21100, partial [Phycisphaerae bacterium]|nr:hypothetical protein [Phycisphaerae bacterium]